MTGAEEDIAARLEAIAEELADLAIARLQAAVADPEERSRLAADERRITRARRAVEKAAALLQERSDD